MVAVQRFVYHVEQVVEVEWFGDEVDAVAGEQASVVLQGANRGRAEDHGNVGRLGIELQQLQGVPAAFLAVQHQVEQDEVRLLGLYEVVDLVPFQAGDDAVTRLRLQQLGH